MSAIGPDAEPCTVCSLQHSVYLTCESAARIVLDDWVIYDDDDV